MQVTLDPVTHTYRDPFGVVLPSTTQILRATILRDAYARVRPERLEVKAALGTAVHAAVRHDAVGALDEPHFDAQWPEGRAYLAAWRLFRREMEGLTVLASELRLGDDTLRYAGTFDLLVLLHDGCPMLIDIKTGSTIGVQYQTAAYVQLASANRLLHWDTVPLLPWQVGRAALKLHDTGRYTFTPITSRYQTDWKRFVAALTVYTAQQELLHDPLVAA